MRENIILSICIPTYNRGERLSHTVRELLQYKGDDIEVIVLDDASTDGSVKYLEEIQDERLKIKRNHNNLGQSKNQAKALFSGSGKYTVALMDRDYILIEELPHLLVKLRNYETPILLAGQKQEVWNSSAHKYFYVACYVTHPSNVIVHTGKLKQVLELQTVYRLMRYQETPFLYYPPIVSLYLLTAYGKYSTLGCDLTKELTKGTSSGDYQRAGGKCTDYYLPAGAWKRIQRHYYILHTQRPKEWRRLFPWVYAAELHLATLWNLEMYHAPDSGKRAGIKRYENDQYYEYNDKIKERTMQLLKKKGELRLGFYYQLVLLAWLNQKRITVYLKEDAGWICRVAEKIWEKLFYAA